MISVKKCRQLLGKEGEKYTDEQLELIRGFLMRMVKINVEIIKSKKSKNDEKGNDNVQG